MNARDQDRLFEALRRGRLTPQDERDLETFLLEHPEQRAACQEDLALNLALRQLPHAPVASNFTSRVLQTIAHERRAPAPPQPGAWLVRFRGWFPQLGAATAVLALGLFSYHQHQLAQRRDLARNLVEMSRLVGGTPLDLLQNFKAIERLDQVPNRVDKDLIAALQ